MSVLILSPEHLPHLHQRIEAHPGPLAVSDLSAWTPDGLNTLRFELSRFDQAWPARIGEAEVTLSDLIDAVVDAIRGRGVKAVRFRPFEMSTVELDRAREVMMDDDVQYYVDGDLEPMDGGVLYDEYEEALFPEAYGAGPDDESGWLM